MSEKVKTGQISPDDIFGIIGYYDVEKMSESEANAYFLVENIKQMFGECPYSQEQLNEFKKYYLENF